MIEVQAWKVEVRKPRLKWKMDERVRNSGMCMKCQLVYFLIYAPVFDIKAKHERKPISARNSDVWLPELAKPASNTS